MKKPFITDDDIETMPDGSWRISFTPPPEVLAGFHAECDRRGIPRNDESYSAILNDWILRYMREQKH